MAIARTMALKYTDAPPAGEPMRFAEKLQKLRKAKGMTRPELAEASGVPLASIHEYIGERRRPTFRAVVKIARALGVTCDAFANCEDIDPEAKHRRKKK
jgi:transcriptional regulator with XRE-family HTH domain